jgi:hypothetical protein
MARSLFWTEKVVLSILVVFLLSFHSALSQPSQYASITYSCSNTRLESVIEFLSRASGYNFIYSRDMVDITKPVSLSVYNKPVGEVLVLIEEQVNVTFRFEDRHIIVKAGTKQAPFVKPAVVAQPAIAPSSGKLSSLPPADSPLLSSVSRGIPTTVATSHRSLLESRLDRRIKELQDLLGPSVPRDIPPMYVNRINFNNRNRGFYASVGVFVSDYSTGLEIQAGLPYLYGIIHPRWSPDRGVYGVYGIGNSFKLMRNFSFNTMYMYSGFTTSETIYPYSSPTLLAGPEFRLTKTSRHHQVKLAVQYSLSKNVTLRFGPVLNYQTAVADLYSVSAGASYERTTVYGQPVGQVVTYQNGQLYAQTTRRTQSWLGWDAAASYRINFSRRK